MKLIRGGQFCSLLVILISLVSSNAAANTPAASEPLTVIVAPTSSTLPAGTLIALRIDQDLSSRTAKRGDKFPISLAHDLWANDRIVIPTGTRGVGEVIHSAGKGFGGRAGELIVTARYLQVDGRQIPLKNFKLGVAGIDNSNAALFSSLAVPIAGLFVTGTSASIGLGQLAQAKLAEPYSHQAAEPSRPLEVVILPAEK